MEPPRTPGEGMPQTAAPSGGGTSVAGTRPNGPAVAVMLAAGIGALVLGILTTVSEASEGLHDFLEWSDRVGPLSGKTSIAAIAFFASWGGLHLGLRDREIDWKPVIIATIALVAVALVLTFPPFFQLFKND
jgi:hypothetical protein